MPTDKYNNILTVLVLKTKKEEQTIHRLSYKCETTCKKEFTELANKQIISG